MGTDLVDGDESTVLLQNHTTHHTRQPLGIVNYTYDTSIMIGDWLKLKSWRPARLNTDNGFMTDLNALLHCWAIHRPYEPLYATISFGMQQMERCEWRCLMCDGWNLMAITMTPEWMGREMETDKQFAMDWCGYLLYTMLWFSYGVSGLNDADMS